MSEVEVNKANFGKLAAGQNPRGRRSVHQAQFFKLHTAFSGVAIGTT